MAMRAPEIPQANVFESGSLDRLRRGLKDPEAADLRRVAEEFESVFVSMMLKNMRAATPGDELFGSDAMDQYQQLYDQQLAQGVGRDGGFGIADMVERQLREQAGLESGSRVIRDQGLQDYDRRLPAMQVSVPEPSDDAGPRVGAPEPHRPGGKGAGWDDPEAFVRDVWPAAERAAGRLGADPRALVAQAALETGWGRHVIRDGDGNSSNNLFGIKADAGWDGDTVQVPTLEFRDGIPQRETASFRAYGSLEEGFRDYARFLENNPRYRDVLDGDTDPDAWMEGLQRAGYATDPDYAEKLRGILDGTQMESALEALKSPPDQPTTQT